MQLPRFTRSIVASLFVYLIFVSHGAASPMVSAEPMSYDFGSLERGELAIAKFTLRNSGDRTVTIKWMEFSKQGLIAQVNPRIRPGSSVEVRVNWDTTNHLGNVEGQIALGLDEPGSSEIVFVLRGLVVPRSTDKSIDKLE